MTRVLIIAGGAALGGVARYLVAGVMQQAVGAGLPLGTLVVNVVGSALLGCVMGTLDTRFALSPEARLFLTIGFLGAFTTFSAFAYETDVLLRDRQPWWAAANVAANVGLSVAAVILGRAAAVAAFG